MFSPAGLVGHLVYNLGWLLLPILLVPALPWLARMPKFTRSFRQRAGFLPRETREALRAGRPVWLHAVSVGEVRAAASLLARLRERHPTRRIVVSTVTVTGQETARATMAVADAIFYLPFDHPVAAARTIALVDPLVFIHTETEIWPNLLALLRRRGVPSIIVNGRISERSVRNYRLTGPYFREVIRSIACCAMQTRADADRIVRAGAAPESVRVTGNMKFELDGREADSGQAERLGRILGLGAGERVIVAGSTHEGEEAIALAAFRELSAEFPDLVLVIAPRHPERFDAVAEELRRAGAEIERRTELEKRGGGRKARVVLLDTIGELLAVYGFADAVFVGGSFAPRGGHNVLEAAALRKPVLYGPRMENFTEIAAALEEADAARRVFEPAGLAPAMRGLLADPEAARRMGERGRAVLEANRGATERNLAAIEELLARAGAAR